LVRDVTTTKEKKDTEMIMGEHITLIRETDFTVEEGTKYLPLDEIVMLDKGKTLMTDEYEDIAEQLILGAECYINNRLTHEEGTKYFGTYKGIYIKADNERCLKVFSYVKPPPADTIKGWVTRLRRWGF